MRQGARAAAAIEILTDLETRKRPAADAVKDWMLTHRFAGSKDRAEIGDTVFGALRWKSSSAWRLGDYTPRAWVFGALHWGFGLGADALEASLLDDPHAPEALSENERVALRAAKLDDAPPWVRGDYPQWLDESFARAFGDFRADEGAALAAPAPLDLRANTLKTTRDELIAELKESPRIKTQITPTPYAADGVRVPWSRGGSFAWAMEQSFQRGWYEVQDEGSQLAALFSGVEPGMQIADVCAGGGGKTLALAALMQNKGQIFAYDVDGRRLAPMRERLDRAGARSVQIRAPARSHDVLSDLKGKLDLVFVDAPCTGSGTWRRNPDSKWRVRPTSLETRRKEQREALALAAPLVKPGGRLVYVTCSVLPEENQDAVAAFVAANPAFIHAPLKGADKIPAHAQGAAVQMTPLLTGCDGFFVAALQRV
ncbi:MAG: RsmB/NOP family class I SAM-dependent RNA methyltransferase [Pseudomonadota bacterium]